MPFLRNGVYNCPQFLQRCKSYGLDFQAFIAKIHGAIADSLKHIYVLAQLRQRSFLCFQQSVRGLLAAILLFVSCGHLQAQTVEQLQETVQERIAHPLQINGSIGLTFGYYESYGIAARRDRYSYLLNGNLNPRLFGIDCPINGNFSQLEANFLQPFNQFGVSPQYKWAKGHLGYRNLTFSPLTLNGHTFLGAGVELAPPIKSRFIELRIGAMYGRLRRPVEPVDVVGKQADPSFRRMGYALKLGIGDKKQAANYLDFILFRAHDVEGSIEAPVGNGAVTPAENLVLGISGQYQLWHSLTLRADWASSAFTRDTRNETANKDNTGFYGKLGGLFTPRISTQTNQSVMTALEYQFSKSSIGLKYNRIAPDYVSMGSYYFQNDLEDLTFNANTSLKGGKIMLGGSLGLQRNNLDNKLNNQSKRVIGSVNYHQAVNDRLNFNASYSNYSSTLLVTKQELSDSLNLFQVSTNYTLGTNYNFGAAERKQTLSLNLSYQNANARDEYDIIDQATDFYNAGLFYNIHFAKRNMGLTGSVNVTRSTTEGIESTVIGPGFGVNKSFLEKKLRARYFVSYRNSLLNGSASFGVLQNRFSVDYAVLKHHRVSLTLSHLYKVDYASSDKSYSEMQGLMGYQFSF